MNCFQHTNKPAIGHCAFCGRGLCYECATTVEGKLSCRGACQEQITRERRLFRQSEGTMAQKATVYKTSANVYQRAFAITVLIGLVMLALGVFLFVAEAPVPGAVLLVIGIGFVVYGISLQRAATKFRALAIDDSDKGSPS